MAFVIGAVVRPVGAAIGLGREAYIYHKEKKQKTQSLTDSNLVNTKDAVVTVSSVTDTGNIIVSGDEIPEISMSERESEDQLMEQDTDERDWALDEATLPPPAYEEAIESLEREGEERPQLESNSSSTSLGKVSSVKKLVATVLGTATSPASPSQSIPYPVVIPQRRPGSKRRGFVRAYAPDLSASGISQDTWLSFLTNFDKASQASPILVSLYTSAAIVGCVPGLITMAVSISVQTVTGIAIEMESRYKANAYLDQVNRDLFMPRGLYVMVMRYRPRVALPDETEIGIEAVNLETAKSVARWSPDTSPPTAGMKIIKHIRLSSGITNGETTMPATCAGLIFPDVDDAAASPTSPTNETSSSPPPSQSTSLTPTTSPTTTPSSQATTPASTKSRIARSKAFIADYYDRRATATYLATHPTSTLSSAPLTRPPTFRSRYADPTSEASNGHLFNLVTGGRAKARPLGYEAQQRRRERDNMARMAKGLQPRDGPGGPVGVLQRGVKRVVGEDVLYLMVVNLPSAAELAAAREVLEREGWTR